MTPYPYPVGAQVAGADCSGKAFTGTVTEILGPYTVKLDGLYATPVVLIHGAVKTAWPDCGCGTQSGPHSCECGRTAEPAQNVGARLSLF